MIVLVTGASGFIGSRLIEHLLAEGQNEIYALVRNPAKLSWLKIILRSICSAETLNRYLACQRISRWFFIWPV